MLEYPPMTNAMMYYSAVAHVLKLTPQLPSGYNNSAVIAALREPGALVSLVNRPSLSVHPSLDYVGRLKNSLLSIAPPGLSKVSTMACGTCSNENAIKASFIKFMVCGVLLCECRPQFINFQEVRELVIAVVRPHEDNY